MIRIVLPCTLTLPGGRRVTVSAREAGPETAPEGTIFDDALAALTPPALRDARDRTPIDARDLPLTAFHVLRAVLVKAGVLEEDEVELDCHNCDELLVTRPCASLEIGPWEDGEIDDPELDATAELGVPLAIAPIPLGRVRRATTVTLAERTVREALPLLRALAHDPLVLDAAVVSAMGITALGPITDPARIAATLDACSEAELGSVTNAFLDAHYPLRLASDVFCPKCKAKNTVDAPALREFDAVPERLPREDSGTTPDRPLPPLEGFVELTHAIADPLLDEIPGDPVMVIVDDGPPAVDDGGVPLLGSYLPPPPDDAHGVVTAPPTVTIYYRTFARIEEEEGPWDWEGELRETIEHELEHHVYFLRGDDPMDAEERAEIDRERVRVVGSSEAARRSLAVFGLSIPEFFRRTWLFILLVALAFVIWLLEARSAP